MTFLNRRSFLAATTAAIALSACSDPKPAETTTDAAAETAKLNAWLEERFQFWVGRSPMMQGYLGMKKDMDKWDDIGDAREAEDLELAKKDQADLRSMFTLANLTPAGTLSHRLYDYEMQQRIDDYQWRHHDYPLNQMFGWQQEIPSFLINIHTVSDKAEAEAYVGRLNGIGVFVDQVLDGMMAREERGVLPPKFVFEHVLRDTRNVIIGAPFDDSGKDSTLFEDFKGKVAKLEISAEEKDKLVADASAALVGVVKPAFEKMIALAEAQQAKTTDDDGVWKLPDGDAYYAYMLKFHTTTTMTADEIHDFGLADVKRIHGEMQAIMQQVGFTGDMPAFFKFMKEDDQFFYPQTDEGKAAYIAESTRLIETMKGNLDKVFLTKPKAEIMVKAVEPFREQSSTSAFYQPPGAFDGRPGTYYANTYDMKSMPKYEMEALCYHEGIPGHHMQIAIAQELQDVPSFRKYTNFFTAYVEGWGLYCERLPKEMGFYQDPYSDFGRLSMELWRACRLVVDTGLHSNNKKWTRAQAVQFLFDNTPNHETEVRNSIDRYIVMPGQATAYKIGMEKILTLREAAKAKLGDKFDIREYHDVVLLTGPVPLTVLEENVDAWTTQKAQA